MSKKSLIFLGSAIVFITATTFLVFFIANIRAQASLKSLIESQSDGKIMFQVEKVKYDLFKLQFDFIEPKIWTKDTTTTETGYHIKAQKISFHIKALIPGLFGKQAIIESIVVQSPEIEVFKYLERPHEQNKKISLPKEMDKVYQPLKVILSYLNLEYLHIDSAKFVVYDRTQVANAPLVLSNINLTVNQVNNEKGNADNRFLFADRILLEIFNQDIQSPDGINRLKFKKLVLSTGSRTINLDSCLFSTKPSNSSSGEYKSTIELLRISMLDFNLLVNQGILKMDSALCINPEINFILPEHKDHKPTGSKRKNLMNKDSLDFMLKAMLGNMDIGYLSVRNAKVNIVTRNVDQSTVFDLKKSDFTLEKFLVSKNPAIPIQAERFYLHLRDYKSYSPDSLYVISFDDVELKNRKISLLNFKIGPTKLNHDVFSKEIKMSAIGFTDIDWSALLYESRIVAGNLMLIQPELNFRLPDQKGSSGTSNWNPFEAVKDFKKKLQIGSIIINDGSMNVDISNGTHLSVNNLNARIGVKEILESTSGYQIINAFDQISFGSGEFKNPSFQLELKNGSYSKDNRSLQFDQISQIKSDKSLMIKLNEVALNGLHISSMDSLLVSEVTWEKADLTFSTNNQKSVAEKPDSNIRLTIGKISGGSTSLNYNADNLEVSTMVNQISTKKIIFQSGKKPIISGLILDGKSFDLKQNGFKSNMSGFHLQDKNRSTLKNVEIRLPYNGEIATFFVPKLIFSVDIEKSLSEYLTADYIEFHDPTISFQEQADSFVNSPKKSGNQLPLLNIKSLIVDHPLLINLPSNLAGKMQIDPGNSKLSIQGIHSDGISVKVDSFRLQMARPGFSGENMKTISNGNESANLKVSNFTFHSGTPDQKGHWSFNLDAFEAAKFRFNLFKADTIKQTITVNSLNVNSLYLQSDFAEHVDQLIKNNEHFRMSNGNLTLENGKTSIGIYNLMVDKATNSLALDSFTFSPLNDRDTFMKDQQYRKSYTKLYSGSIEASGIDFNLLVNGKIINSMKIAINDLHFLNYIDKRLPFQTGIDKPRLTELIKSIKPKLVIDTLLFRNSGIVSEEINDKTLQHGTLFFTNMRGRITGVRNCNFSANDSLGFNIYAKLLDTAEIRMNYKQSYTDSLSSFHLKAIVSPFDLRALNSILKPFASAKVTNGFLDTIRMSVIGRKYVAFGIMKMYYHDLNVEYLNKGVEDHPTLKTRLISFFANSIVHKNNRYGSGEVYAERDQQKSFVNFWVKIFIGGVLTNTGVRSDKKQDKKYSRSIEKHNVPPIPNIPVDY